MVGPAQPTLEDCNISTTTVMTPPHCTTSEAGPTTTFPGKKLQFSRIFYIHTKNQKKQGSLLITLVFYIKILLHF
jgi:hypothetical protein